MNADEAAVIVLVLFAVLIGGLCVLDLLVSRVIGPDPDLQRPWDPRD